MAWLDGTTIARTAQQLEAALRAIVNATTSAALSITQTGNTSASTSVGGALNINNTQNTGAGLVIYSDQASPSGRLLAVRADNVAFSQSAAIIQQDGTGHALHADLTQTNSATASALNITSANTANSAMFVSGVETGRGTVKITHTGTGSDANAAALSMDLAGSGTAAQGIFIDATGGGTTGDLIDARNNSTQLFKVKTNGFLEFGNGGPKVCWGTGSPEGVVTAPIGSEYKRSDGSTGTSTYFKESGTGNTGWRAVQASAPAVTTSVIYYVDSVSGSDANSGLTTGLPWASISKINSSTFNTGDQILFKRGSVWRGTMLQVPSSGVTFGAYGATGDDPVLSGGQLVATWTLSAGSTYSATLAAMPAGIPSIVTATTSGTTTLLTKGTGTGTLTANQWFWSGGALYIHLGGTNPNTATTVEVATRSCVDTYTKSGLTFKNIVFSHANDACVKLTDASGHLISRCTFQYSTYNGTAGALNIARCSYGYVRVTYCTFDYLSNDGVYVTSTSNVEIDHCTVTNIGTLALDDSSDGIQIEAYSANNNCDGFWIHDNYVSIGAQTIKGGIIMNAAPSVGGSCAGVCENNICVGGNFGVAAHASDIIVRNNVIHGQTVLNQSGIWIDPAETYYSMEITNNLIYDVSIGIQFGSGANSRQITLVNNTFVDCTRAQFYADSPIYGVVKNNIFWNTVTAPTLRTVYIVSVASGATLSMNNNLYNTTYTDMFRFGATPYSTIATWRAATGLDAASTTDVNPLFVYPAGQNYQLAAASPARNVGVIIPSVAQAFLGSAPDLGYLELPPAAGSTSVAITYSSSMTPNANAAKFQKIVVTNTTAMTINAPTNPVNGAELTFDIMNSSGSVMGTITWNAVFKMVGGSVPNPAGTPARRRLVSFYYDGTNWVETGRSSGDI